MIASLSKVRSHTGLLLPLSNILYNFCSLRTLHSVVYRISPDLTLKKLGCNRILAQYHTCIIYLDGTCLWPIFVCINALTPVLSSGELTLV